jgi:hypothetical protein
MSQKPTTNQDYVGTDREAAGLKVQCPHCRRRPGEACITPRGEQYGGWMTLKLHRKRLLAADVDRRCP